MACLDPESYGERGHNAIRFVFTRGKMEKPEVVGTAAKMVQSEWELGKLTGKVLDERAA